MPRQRPLYYVLDDAGEPLAIDDVIVWGQWFETAHRQLADDKDEGSDGAVRVSTVFLGLDRNHSGDGPPVLWETLIFGGPLDGDMRRYSSREAALAGHRSVCETVRLLLGKS